MPTFHYANPNVVHWGPGCVEESLDGDLRHAGARRVLLVTTASAAREPRLAGHVRSILGERLAGAFASVAQHAPAESIARAVDEARRVRADCLISLGGGSPIDAAKAVAFVLATGIDLSDPAALPRAREAQVRDTLPHLAVPTTLSAAELSGSAGFSAAGSREKVGVVSLALRPRAVLYDASLAVLTPLPLWLSTGLRAVDHAVETLLAEVDQPLPETAAAEALRRLRAGLLAARARPDDPAPRTECQLGAWLSFLLPAVAARGLSHTLGKRLGSRHGIPHGVTSCLLLPHVVRYLAPRHPRAAARVAEALGGADAAGAISALLDALELPRHLSAWRLTDDELVEAARPVASPEHPQEALLEILRAAL
jgi:alcohol dehydrogenase class IV